MVHVHKASYNLGERELNPEERVVIGTRPGPKEPRRVAEHLGLSPYHPKRIIKHNVWMDGEYLSTFMTREGINNPSFLRYKENYFDENGNLRWGYGLKGKTVYIVHTLSNEYHAQDLDMRIFQNAYTAKYNGAEAVVLLAYTLDHSAQERGVHDDSHERMQTDKEKEKFDGQAPISKLMLDLCLTSGIDAIITPDNHCPDDIRRLCEEVNAENEPKHLVALADNLTMRYHLDFVHIDLAPMYGYFLAEMGHSHLGFDVSDKGRNIIFMSPDMGAEQRVMSIREQSGLTNSAFALMNKNKDSSGVIQTLELAETINMPETGLDGRYVVVFDDSIRSGRTMSKNIEALVGMQSEELVRDSRIKGTPAGIAVVATRTNFAGNSIDILSSDAIDYVVITNSDPRGFRNLGDLDQKTIQIWINFMMADAARCVERGQNPNSLLTYDYIRKNDLVKIAVPHGHALFTPKKRKNGIY